MNANVAVPLTAGHCGDTPKASTSVPWHQVASFTALTYALSWIWWAPLVWPHMNRVSLTEPLPNALADGGGGRAALGMFGPAIAALIMRRVHREPLRGSLGAKRSWRYYAIAVAAPALFVAGVVIVDVAAGFGRFQWPLSPVLTFAGVLFVGSAFTLPLTIGEEYGWRGYLLPRLLPLGEARGTFILAAIWGLWHVPILLIGLNYPGQFVWAVLPVFLVSVTLTAFPFTWLYVASGGSVLVAAVMHGVLNALGDTFTSARYLPDGNSLVVGGGGLVGAAVLLGMVTVVAAVRSRHIKHGQGFKIETRLGGRRDTSAPSVTCGAVVHDAALPMDLTRWVKGLKHKHNPEEERRIREAALDETLAATFPASDAPSTLPNPDDHAVVRQKES